MPACIQRFPSAGPPKQLATKGADEMPPRFRINTTPVPPRQFVLPAHERSTAPAPLPELGKPFKLHEWGPGLATETRKRPVAAQTAKRTAKQPVEAQAPPKRRGQAQMGGRGAHTVSAPVGPRKGRTILDFTAASDASMPGFLGTIALKIDPDAVDLERLELGLLSLATDHDVTRLLGRITEATIHGGLLDMRAEVSNTPQAKSTMSEIDDLTRLGFSPGFLVIETEVIDADSPDYDESEMFQIRVTKWMPFEISSTAIPRSPDARLRGVASMGNVIDMDTITGAPEVVSTSDLIGLSLEAGRQVLASGKGSAAQRATLKQFYALFNAGLERGLTRDVAAQAAKAVAGL